MIRDVNVNTVKSITARWCGVKAYKKNVPRLYFPHCKAVHTFGVKKILNLWWVNKAGQVVKVENQVSRNRIKYCANAFGVIETQSDTEVLRPSVGDCLRLKGQALVETVLVLPFLILLLLGFLELGLVLQAQQRLTHAVQLATQVGSLTNNDEKLFGSLGGFYDASAITIAIESINHQTDSVISSSERRYSDMLMVAVRQPYQLNIPYWPLNPFDLSASASAPVLCQNSVSPYQCD
jgi:hypothetical protein